MQVLEEKRRGLMVVAILNRVLSARFLEKEILYEMLEGVKGVSNAAPQGKDITGRGKRTKVLW